MKKALFLMMCLCFSISVLAQAKTVTGTVVDAIGEPIIGASVLEMGSVVILGGLIFVNFPLCIHLC